MKLALEDKYQKAAISLEAGKRWLVPEQKVILRSGGDERERQEVCLEEATTT